MISVSLACKETFHLGMLVSFRPFFCPTEVSLSHIPWSVRLVQLLGPSLADLYKNDRLALFRNTNIYLKPEKNSYDNPIQYTNDPLLSGYISEENAELIKNSVPFKVKRLGKGRVNLVYGQHQF